MEKKEKKKEKKERKQKRGEGEKQKQKKKKRVKEKKQEKKRGNKTDCVERVVYCVQRCTLHSAAYYTLKLIPSHYQGLLQ